MLSREAFLTWDTMPHFSAEHFCCLGAVLVLTVLAAVIGRSSVARSARAPAAVGAALAWVCASGYLLWLVAAVSVGAFVPQRDLPLEFCYVVGIAAPTALMTRNQVAFDFFFYGATSGVLHACLTPVYPPSFPHPRFFAFWALHGGAIVAAVYAVAALGRRPTYLGIFTSVGVVACVLCVVIPVNHWLDANYFYLRQKPAGSVLDVLGPWPLYVTAILGLGLLNFHLAYLPFAFTKKPTARA